MYSGGFYPFPAPEEFWAYWSRYILLNRYQDPPKPVYPDLLRLLAGKDHFVLTTNVDHCFQKAGFEKKRLFYTQGDYGLFQCSGPCRQETFGNEAAVRAMVLAQGFTLDAAGELVPPEKPAMAVPAELLPRCPHCGRPLVPNLRCDEKFAEDEGWHQAAERYESFLRTRSGQRILFLELGVGYNTPVFCSSSTRDNSKNIRLKRQISGFSSNKQKDLKEGGMRNVWQKNVKSRKHAGLYQQAA